jgi:D-serine deaminase-like pyridoxal phosphate-dependent protein
MPNTFFKQLDTPCLIVEQDILEANLERIAKLAAEKNIKLRPHAKTHKNVQIARKQLQSGAVGLTLAKTSEAAVFAENGISDIFLAYPVVGEKKIMRLMELATKCQVSVGIDSIEGAAELNQAFASRQKKLPILLEVDTGLGRTGIGLEKARLMAEEIIRMPNLKLKGIYTYRGALLGEIKGTTESAMWKTIEKQGRTEAEIMGKLAEDLRKLGFAIEVVSAGSTPTARSSVSVPGLTEIRPGTYVFNDAMQVNLGACNWKDCAAKVLVTVVSRPTPDRAIIDGGSKVFAGDVKPDTPPLNLKGFGTVIAEDGQPREDILFERMTEEHGMLRLFGSAVCNLKVGERLLVIPNHICTTVNLFNDLLIVNNSIASGEAEIIATWPVNARGRVQ